MNRLIIVPDEMTSSQGVIIAGRRAEHIRKTLKTPIEGKVKFGLLNGGIGHATLEQDCGDEMHLSLEFTEDKPAKQLPCILVMALPRPKAARRLIQSISSLGFEQLHLINSYKVDKSYWQSHYLGPQVLKEQLVLGLEQCGSTLLPEVHIHKKFRPFAEDLFPSLCKGRVALLAHPYAVEKCPSALNEASVLVVGPDGGFTDFEVDLLEKNGAKPVTIGDRILRVETAIPLLAGRLYL